MISPTSSQAVANLAVAAAGVAAAGVGAAARAVATPTTGRAPAAGRPAAAAARKAAGAPVAGGLVRAARSRTPAVPIRRTTVPGYAAATTASGSSAEFAFLKDPRLSLEDKLMRLLMQLNKKWEADIQKKMEEVAAGRSSQPAARKKKGGVAGMVADVAGKVLGPSVGALLRAPGVGTALGKLAAPVAAAAASALGAPALAPAILKAGPAIVSGLATAVGTQAATAQAGDATSGAGLSEKEVEAKYMEIQRLKSHQDEMFRLVSQILRASHDTRLNIIGNVR